MSYTCEYYIQGKRCFKPAEFKIDLGGTEVYACKFCTQEYIKRQDGKQKNVFRLKRSET